MMTADPPMALAARVAQLTARVERLERAVVETAKQQAEELEKRSWLIHNGQEHDAQRIRELELKVFPHLQDVMRQVEGIVGATKHEGDSRAP